ncbi:MAG: DNA adenine methylase [Spirochaetaceae bacterium]|nr:DNA adenine methylase [Spirochaetaceae bacterium]
MLRTTFINNRRYLGNKYKLLPFITSVVSENCDDIKSVADIFAGTGAVASAFTDKQLITNDNLYSNYICHYRVMFFIRRN